MTILARLRLFFASFRGRLTLFFVSIVIVPMVSVAFVLFRLISDSENGKADARIATRLDAAINLFYEARDDADRVIVAVSRDPGFSLALRTNDDAKVQRRVRVLRQRLGATRLVVSEGDRVIADDGARSAVFPATRQLTTGTRVVARVQASTTGAAEYARLVRRITRLESVVRRGDDLLAATLDGSGRVPLPRDRGKVEIGDTTYRAATFKGTGFTGERISVSVLESEQTTVSQVRESRLLAAGILLGFFVLAFTFAVLVSRSLQRQIAGFLDAARRLGAGDFSAGVPTTGRDEFAALGEEFNKMSRQLEARLEELARERARLELAMRRIGETFASNLDRDALLQIVVGTAADGVAAAGARASLRHGDGPLDTVVQTGKADGFALALDEAEDRVLRHGEPVEVSDGDLHVLAHPLRAGAQDDDVPPRLVGIVSVWREGRAFSAGESELFHYLSAQAAVSLENVGLHEVVERQAVTDELTGLSNRRRFQETLATEVERSKRFGQEVGLVLLDIDDFKRVNDTYGHQQGDTVLREVARILRESAREIDEPARYGGEELAAVLPGTDLEGAYNFAERVREGIEGLALPVAGDGEVLRVTASFGVAALPGSADDVRSLVAAADDALYAAKRAGKNRTLRAVPAG